MTSHEFYIKNNKLFFSLDGTVKYWTPDGINNKQKITSYEMIEDNSFIKVKESGLYMIYSQVKKSDTG